MSIRVMSLVWDSTVPAPERFTLLALADRADEEGRCWPSIKTLAQKCCTGESTVRRHLTALTKQGVVEVEHRWNDSSMYVINLDRLREFAYVPKPTKRTRTPSRSDTPRQIDTPSRSDRGSRSDTPSQSERTPPPRLSGPPSQIEHLSITDPSGDPSGEEHPPAPRAVAVDGFAEFYAAYPRRQDRRDAERAWKAALKRGAHPQHVIAAAGRYSEQVRSQGTDRRYVKLPATWLNKGAYDNDVEQPALALVSNGYQAWRNPADQSEYDAPLLPPNPQENQ